MSDKDNITLPRELVERARKALKPLDYYMTVYDKYEIADSLFAHRAAPRPEPVAYFDLQKQVFYWAKPTMIDVPMTVALNPLPLYAAPPAAAPDNAEALRRDASTAPASAAVDASWAMLRALRDALRRMDPAWCELHQQSQLSDEEFDDVLGTLEDLLEGDL